MAAACLVTLLSACAAGGGAAPAGFYRIEKGDTLTSIARKNGRSVAELRRWNSVRDPDRIEVGELLRVEPPVGASAAPDAGATLGSTPPRHVTPRNVPGKVPNTGTVAPATQTIDLAWPASGELLQKYDGGRSKGIDLAGQPGEPVKAAASGEVVYVGQLRGYGNLLIVKHNASFLTSYAHLQSIAVKEKQSVQQGETIATLGQSEATRPMLHFEVRYLGRPVDPMRYLPAR